VAGLGQGRLERDCRFVTLDRILVATRCGKLAVAFRYDDDRGHAGFPRYETQWPGQCVAPAS
jgi:hypothetical protein